MKSGIVFIVDDDPLVHFTIKKQIALIAPEINITSFSNPTLLILFLENNGESINSLPDIIILDINMPLMDGLEFLDRYEELKDSIMKKPRIYVCSSTADLRELTNARADPNVTGLLSKPLNMEELRGIL